MDNQEKIIIRRPLIVKHFWPIYFSIVFMTSVLSAILLNLLKLEYYLIIPIVFCVAIFLVYYNQFFFLRWNKKIINLMNNNQPILSYRYYCELLSKPYFLSPLSKYALNSNKNLAYFYMGHYEEALQIQKQMVMQKRKSFRLLHYHNLAFYFFINNDITSARSSLIEMEKYNKGRKIHLELINKSKHIINIYSDNVIKSYDFFKNECEKEEKRLIVVISNYFLLAKCCIKLGYMGETKEYLNKIINIDGENLFIILAKKLVTNMSNN